jgi:hypothetical protein
MRRLALMTGIALAVLSTSTPAQAFFHSAVTNVYLHAALDLLTFALVTAPILTAYLWAGRRRGMLIALVALVQLPVAIAGFVPIINPVLHLAMAMTAVGLTAATLVWVRRSTCTETEARPVAEAG